MMTRMHHRSQSWAMWIHFASSHPVSLKATQVLFLYIYTHIFQVVSFLQVFQQEIFLHFASPHMCHVPHVTHFSVMKIILHMENFIKLPSVLLSLKSCYFFPLWCKMQWNPQTSYKNYNQALLQTIKLSRKKERKKLQDHIADTWYA
jgi:hypothetical protein